MKNKSNIQKTINSSKNKSNAQGTIEYLVIIAIVVIIALIVVSLLLSQTNTSQQISTTSNKLGSTIGQGGISVIDSITSSSGDMVISLQNNSGQNLTIKKINTVDDQGNTGEDNYCIKNLSSTKKTECILTNINELCSCRKNQSSTCKYKITYTTSDGLTKTETIEITTSPCTPITLYTVTFNAGTGGKINDSNTYTEKVIPGKNSSTITATPNEGYDFNSWSDGTTNPTKTITNVTENKTITATFTPKELSVEDQYFIFLIRTIQPDQDFKLYTADAVDLNINWGDGNIEVVNGTEFKSHTYPEIGDYNIWLQGSASKISFGENQSGTSYAVITTYTPIQNGVTGITDMSQMFMEAWRFNGDISDWDTSNVTNMELMFSCHEGDGSFSGDVSGWDTSNVISMNSMFNGQRNFNSNIGDWNTSKLENASGMFHGASGFNQDISKWDMSNVSDMSRMFLGTTSFNQNINDWNTSNVTAMDHMFSAAYSFNQDLSGWDTSKVKDIERMFYLASSFNQDISAWNMSNVENMYLLFGRASSFNQDLNSWDTSNVNNMSMLFYNATDFNGDISDWDVSNVGNMSRMFDGASSFNRDISNWETYNVDYMDYMFKNASSFNQDLSGWDVSAVINYTNFDENATAWQEGYKPNFQN